MVVLVCWCLFTNHCILSFIRLCLSIKDQAVRNSFVTLMRLGFFDGHPSKQIYGKLGKKDICTQANQDLAREAARQGIVLLKNNLGFPGQEGGAALADVIFGRYNPSGRLPMTWYPRSYANKVSMTNMNMRADPSTGYPGRSYRFYRGDTVYPFGFGLSYSLYVHKLIKAPKQVSIGLHKAHICSSTTNCTSINITNDVCNGSLFNVDIMVTNIGKMSGSHTVLLFSYPPQVIKNSPNKQLLDFKRVQLDPWNTTSVSFNIDVCKQLSVVDEDGNRKLALGGHVLQMGDLKHSISLKV